MLNPMKHIMAILMGVSPLNASIVDQKLLHNIAIIESNLNDDAIGSNGERGAFQLKREAWLDGIAWQRINHPPSFEIINPDFEKYAHDFDIASLVAIGFLSAIEERMKKDGYRPTPIRIYMAYNLGYHGAKRIKFDPNSQHISPKRRAIFLRAANILSR